MKRNGLRITLGDRRRPDRRRRDRLVGRGVRQRRRHAHRRRPVVDRARPVRRHPPGGEPADRHPAGCRRLPTDTVSHELPAPPADPSECPAADGSAAQQREFTAAPPLCIDPAKTYTALVSTNHGDFTVELDSAAAPITVNNFVVLARYHYFDDTICHRIIPDFVVQCGDPTATGSGGPGYAIPTNCRPPAPIRSVPWRWRTVDRTRTAASSS